MPAAEVMLDSNVLVYAHTLYSKGLSDGREYDGVKVVNPFLALD